MFWTVSSRLFTWYGIVVERSYKETVSTAEEVVSGCFTFFVVDVR